MNEPVLTIEQLTVALPAWADRPVAVDDVSLQLHRNEVLCVVGESGSGKSVLARAVMGLLAAPHVRATGGRILFGAEDLLQVDAKWLRSIRGSRIGMVFQEPMTALNPLMTIGRQIAELLETHTTLTSSERRQRVMALMAEVRLPDPERIYQSYPHQLSGGQRQRAMIVMALLLEPAILIADEPTTALDVTTQAQILALIKDLQRQRETGVLFITHDFGVVAEIADRVAIMQRGALVEIGPVASILTAPQHPYTQRLIAAVPTLTPPRRTSRADAPVVLHATGVTKSYLAASGVSGSRFWPWFQGQRTPAKTTPPALNNADVVVRQGEIVGLVGESGSGKSTLARCVTRLIDADSGQIVLNGSDISALSRAKLRPLRKHVQMIFQDPYASLNPRQTVARQIALGPLAHGVAMDAALREVTRLLALVQLEPSAAHRYPHEFSGGQRQRIGIARALAMNPALLIADEPVSALDVSVQERILALLLDIRDQLGVAMLFVTHDLRVAAQICDRMLVMHQGEIVEEGDTARLFADPQHAYTQSLLAAVPGRGWQWHQSGKPPESSGA